MMMPSVRFYPALGNITGISRGLSGILSTHHQNVARGPTDHLFGHATEKSLAKRTVAASSHDDQICVAPRCVVANDPRGNSGRQTSDHREFDVLQVPRESFDAFFRSMVSVEVGCV